MHIVKFQGGLANQLFQLCLYNKLIEKYGKESVRADISHYKTNNDHGGYKLDDYYQLSYINELPEGCLVICEKNFDIVVFSGDRDYYYNGYWQSEVFFPRDISFINDIVRVKYLDKDREKLIQLIETSASVSIHIRRGDYVNNPFHGNIANMAYINNAIDYIKKHIYHPIFFVFSDDISWCRENLSISESECHYVSGDNEDATTDLFMMSLCNHNIISNSSFSWWAQRLNKNENKVVISPEYWFNDGGNLCIPEQTGFVYVKNIPSIPNCHEDPIFSIIVNFGNNEIYLRRFLASILNQKFERIEILVVDNPDKCTHKTLMDCACYNAKIHVIESKGILYTFRGIISAWKNVKGKYVVLADAKDFFSERYWSEINIQLNNSQDGKPIKWLFRSEEKRFIRYATLFKIEKAFEQGKSIVNEVFIKMRNKLK